LRSLLILILFITLGVYAQELPPIQNFSPLNYNGENQNWAISQGSDNHIYIANNHSLLVYNGVNWRKYASPNNSIIRSVQGAGHQIFTGQYMEFGYWEKNPFGTLVYTSISDELDIPMIEDEEFWNIITLGNWILFQSLDRIYNYNIRTKEFKWIEASTTKAHIFNVDGSVYYQNENKDVYSIHNGKPKLELRSSALEGRNVVGIYSEFGRLILILDNADFLEVTDSQVKKRPANFLKSRADIIVYTTKKLTDGSYVLGTISDGVYQIDSKGDLKSRINRRNGLNNNTILSIFQDTHKNLWLGLDNGISVINMDSPFNEFIDNSGALGLVYASKIFENQLYLGTNQGLFVRENGSEQEFTLIRGTEGQVWSLESFDGNLLCGHNNGTYLIRDATAKLISDFPGTWGIKRIVGKPNLFLQGNFNGISILERKGLNWSFRNKLEGFDISTRFFEMTGTNQILVNHEIKGLFSLTVDEDFNEVKDIVTHSQMGYGSSLATYNNKVIYSSINGAFAKTDSMLSFKSDSVLNRLLLDEGGGIASIALPDKVNNKLWFFTQKGLSVISPEVFSNELTVSTIPIPNFFRRGLGVAGFENISLIRDNTYLIGVSNGFVTLNMDNRKTKDYEVAITSVENIKAIDDAVLLLLSGDIILDYEVSSIDFSFAVPQYAKYSEVLYQYKLQGLFEEWSTWSSEPNVSFNNLSYGDYVFQVRAKVGNTITTNSATYTFEIKKPWYLSITALLMYGILAFFFFWLLHRFYKAYYTGKQKRILAEEKKRLKRKKLKSAKELAQLKNEKLKSEIESKNRELAVSTMSIIKKNELLNTIKGELASADDLTKIKSVIRTIDRNISNEDDWKFFEEAFNNADKDFLKKIKEAHPKLTPNDLRLCAYLRLNLSSKEIAPLLNISVRSVEVKRYRLRKKMELPRDTSLTSYILDL